MTRSCISAAILLVFTAQFPRFVAGMHPTATGEEPQFWDYVSVVIADVSEVKERENDFDIIRIRPIAKLSGPFDTGAVGEFEARTLLRPHRSSLIREPVTRGGVVLTAIGYASAEEKEVAGYYIEAEVYHRFMPSDRAALCTLENTSIGRIDDTLVAIQKAQDIGRIASGLAQECFRAKLPTGILARPLPDLRRCRGDRIWKRV